jgi:hypothetical protein
MWEDRKKHPGERPGKLDYIRMMRTMGHNVEDSESLGQAYEVMAAAEAFIGEAVGRLRVEGYSWEEIAARVPSHTGRPMTRQGAMKKWREFETAARASAPEREGS